MATSRFTRKGQITVPVEIRRSLGFEEGDEVVIREVDGTVVLESPTSIFNRTAGIFAKHVRGRIVTDEEIDEVSAQAAVERYLKAFEDET